MLTTRLHIVKAKKGLQVRLPATNGKLLYSSEVFTQKPAAWKNITAVMNFFKGKGPFLVQDDTLVTGPVVYKMTAPDKVVVTNIKPKK